jgi:hypothetical protein
MKPDLLLAMSSLAVCRDVEPDPPQEILRQTYTRDPTAECVRYGQGHELGYERRGVAKQVLLLLLDSHVSRKD